MSDTGAPVDTVIQIGDPRLRRVAEPVSDFASKALARDVARLHRVLAAFRAEHGFGRAVAAPQIDIDHRFVALHLPAELAEWPDEPFTMFNPEIVWRSPETFTLWDDCMSFPFMLVRVARHRSISVRYQDERGQERLVEQLDQATAELLQHEIDHLDGVLATDHALGPNAIVSRQVFEGDQAYFASLVDYTIGGSSAQPPMP